jgi:nucleoside-diphosphate-sugar epimerase
LDYTIIRSAVVYGPHDGFTNGLAQLLHALPIFLLPGDGESLLQPLWVEDLVTCLTWALDDNATRNQVFEIGGPEYLTFRDLVILLMDKMGIRRTLVPLRPPYLRAFTLFLADLIPSLPVSTYWLDYLATNRTCSLDTIPRFFNLMPARLTQRLAYLTGENWRRIFWGSVLHRKD